MIKIHIPKPYYGVYTLIPTIIFWKIKYTTKFTFRGVFVFTFLCYSFEIGILDNDKEASD